MNVGNYLVSKNFCGLVMVGFLLLGCQTIVDMDKTIAPINLMWMKPGVSNQEKSNALIDCGNKIRQREDLMRAKGIVQFDFNTICMLKKGYTFVPRPEGYINWCNSQMYPNSIACKSYRGEYRVEDDRGKVGESE